MSTDIIIGTIVASLPALGAGILALLFEWSSSREARKNTPAPAQETNRANNGREEPPSPIGLYERSGRSLADAPAGTQRILALAEESHRKQQDRRNPRWPSLDDKTVEALQRTRTPEEIDKIENSISTPQPPALPTTGHDDAVMAMLGGAEFGPNASVTLPSGETIGPDEANAWSSLYRNGDPEDHRDHSR